MIINSKTFDLIRKTGKTLSIAISGFAASATFTFNNVFGLVIEYVVSLAMGAYATISLRTVSIGISVVKLSEKISQTISAKRISVIANIRETIKVASTIDGAIALIPLAALREKVLTSMSNRVPITFAPILAQFNFLVAFDYLTLATVDVETLGDMDYTLV